MRPLPPALNIVGGLAAGAALALFGTSLAGDGAAPQPGGTIPATTTTAAAIAPGDVVYWHAPGEIVLGPTVLVPRTFAITGGEATLAYDLVDIAPASFGINTFRDPDVPVAAPELWTLVTTSGPVPGRTAATRARTARFQLPSDFDPETVLGVRLDRYRVRLPLIHEIQLAVNDTSEVVLDEETSVALRFLLPQAHNTIVQFTITHPFDGFDTSSDGFAGNFRYEPQVRGVGPGWSNVGPTETGIQLTYTGDELPDPMPLRITTHNWVKSPADHVIDLRELPDE